MKKKPNLLIPLTVIAMTVAGCTENVTEEQFIRLEETTYSFLDKENYPVTIDIYASGEWTAESSASWVKLLEQDASTLTINVEDNQLPDERSAEITFRSGNASETVSVIQLANTTSDYRLRYPRQFFHGSVISPNGKYVGGIIQHLQPDDSYIYELVVIDVEADERHTIANVPQSLFYIQDPYAITDNGLFFVMEVSGHGCVAFDLDGNYFLPTNYGDFKISPKIQAVSADGNVWVGYEQSDVTAYGGMYHPVKWIDGTPELLPFPETNFRGQEFSTGIMARGVNHDGSVIYGSTWEDTDFGMVYWKDGKVAYVGEDVHEYKDIETEEGGMTVMKRFANGITCQAECLNISPNGKYIAGTYVKEFDENGNILPNEEKYPAFYNTETKKTTIITDNGAGGGVTATDYGIGIATYGDYAPTSGYVVDIDNGVVICDMQEWIKDTYGITTPVGYIIYMCPDKQTFLARTLEFTATGPKEVGWFVTANGK